MPGLCPLQYGIDRNVHEPCTRGGERQNAGKTGLGQPARHSISRRETLRQQRSGGPADLHLELAIGERLFARSQGRGIRTAAGDQMIERKRRRIQGHGAVIAAGEQRGNDVAVTMPFD